jgi:hypothetical protein
MKSKLLLICLMVTLQAEGQSSWKSFWKLSCPEKTWVLLHPFIASKSRKLTSEALKVTEQIKKDSTLDGDGSGGQVDAFRHAYWMALLSQKICWKKALSLGRAHEKGNYRKFKKGKYDEEGSLPDSVSSEMDLFNNEIGAIIGCQNSKLSTDSLQKIIEKKLKNGDFRVIFKNKEGLPLDCNGKIIDISRYSDRWDIPKCLIPSDLQRF